MIIGPTLDPTPTRSRTPTRSPTLTPTPIPTTGVHFSYSTLCMSHRYEVAPPTPSPSPFPFAGNNSSASPPPPSFLLKSDAATSSAKSLDTLCRHSRFHAAFDHCLRLRSLKAAHLLHSYLRTSRSHTHTAFVNRLIDLFCKCGSLKDARNVFDEMSHPDTCSFNTLINGYSIAGELAEARRIFELIPVRDHISWSSIIACYTRHKCPLESLELYRRMLREMGAENLNLNYNKFTASSALAATTAVLSLRHGKEIHCHAVRAGMESDAVLWSALSDMYAKCGSIDNARRVFDLSSDRDVVSWTAMIGGYFDGGRTVEGLALFSQMLSLGVRPNDFTFAAVLDSCSDGLRRAWKAGPWPHAQSWIPSIILRCNCYLGHVLKMWKH
ncbi:Pentatricopeptide repeat-containing protein [Platanthera zijinensis]|uniref:Pentatricopeptide repeat-containing protein n=1 Tax=Platanthera zijinensis TaxID=2320716 RepID=A0AAP0ASC3_9ASPA